MWYRWHRSSTAPSRSTAPRGSSSGSSRATRWSRSPRVMEETPAAEVDGGPPAARARAERARAAPAGRRLPPRPGARRLRAPRHGRRRPRHAGAAVPGAARAGSRARRRTSRSRRRRGVARLAQVDSHHPLGAGNWVGRRIPIHASSMGKVFMAFGAAQPPFGRLPRLGPNTITSIADLLAELEQVRRNGYATTWEELEAGLCSTAAPVRGSRGTVIAAISVSAPTVRTSRERLGDARRATSSRRRTRSPTTSRNQQDRRERQPNDSRRDPHAALRPDARRRQAGGRRAHRAGPRGRGSGRSRCSSTR